MSIPIVVVGAGVIGLTAALQLKRANPEYDVAVVAHHLPGDYDITYTSPFAGANWHSFAGNDTRVQQIDTVGYHEFLRLAADPRSGVWRQCNALFYTQKALDAANGDTARFAEWFGAMANMRDLSKAELLRGTVYGHEFDGVVISVPTYLPYLVQRCLEAGVAVRRIPTLRHIDHARTLHPSGQPARVVVNCTGLLAPQLAGVTDPNTNYVVRGQVAVVRNNISKVYCVEGFDEPGEMLYMFPRKEGGCIIGGSFAKDNWDAKEDVQLTQRIFQRALRHVPELTDAALGNPPQLDVVRVNVGLRPFREGGVRLEIDPERRWLIHNYGAGGGGYQGSYGCAQAVVELAGQALAPVAAEQAKL